MDTQTQSQNQNSATAQIPQKKHFRGFWPIVIIAVIAFIAGGVILIFAYNSSLQEDLNSLSPLINKTRNTANTASSTKPYNSSSKSTTK